mgnify:FL=1|tara:strand:- start:125 stop:397 length:273 start_codon:yes stop_codon:yes gene_type:complete
MYNVEWAKAALRNGSRISRAGWKKEYIVEIKSWEHSLETVGFEKPKDLRFKRFVGMKTADNKMVPWSASLADCEANDWVIADTATPPADI